MTGQVTRDWVGGRRLVIDVTAGDVPLGRIRPLPAEDWRGRWSVTDYDGYQLPEVVGDYLDAERVLIEATKEEQ